MAGQKWEALTRIESIRWAGTKDPFFFKGINDAVKSLIDLLVDKGVFEDPSGITKATKLEEKSTNLPPKLKSQNDRLSNASEEQPQFSETDEDPALQLAIMESLKQTAEETVAVTTDAQQNEEVGGAGSRKLVDQLEKEKKKLEKELKNKEALLEETRKKLAQLRTEHDAKVAKLKEKAAIETDKRIITDKEIDGWKAFIHDHEKIYYERQAEVLALRQSLAESEEKLKEQKTLLKAKMDRILRLRKELLKLGHADPTVESEDGPLTPATPITRPNNRPGGGGGTPGNPPGDNPGGPGGPDDDPPGRGGNIGGDEGRNNNSSSNNNSDTGNHPEQHHFDAVRAKCKGQHDGWDLFIATGMVLWETLGFNLDSFKRLVEFLLIMFCTPVFYLLWLKDIVFYLDNSLAGHPRARQFPTFFRLRPRLTKERGYLLVTNATMAFLLYHAFKTWAVSSGMLRLMLEANGSSRAYYRDVTTYGVPSLYGVPGIDDRFWQEWGTVGEMPLFCREMWMLLQSVWWSPVWKYFGQGIGGGVRVFQLEE